MNRHLDKPPKVFISYSHDSQEHCEKVLQFSNKLRSEGIDSWIDQYEIFPPEGWPRWMEQQIERADFVLMICTETYAQRVKCKEKMGVGLGVQWESHLIYQCLYKTGANNNKFIPILLDNVSINNIPSLLQSYNHFRVDFAPDYKKLYMLLTHQNIEPVPLGRIRKLPKLDYCSQPKTDFQTYMVSKWLTALERLRETGQIDSTTTSNVLRYVTKGTCSLDNQPTATLVKKITDLPNWEQQLWLSMSEEAIAAKLITAINGRFHQILAAIRFDLNLVIVELGIRFVLIPPGTDRDGRTNRTFFYLAEAPLSQLEWNSIMSDVSCSDMNANIAITELSVNRVRSFLNRSNQLLQNRAFFDSRQWNNGCLPLL